MPASGQSAAASSATLSSDESPVSRSRYLARRILELRWWIAAIAIYCIAMGHLEGIDPARPDKLRIVKHALVAGLGALAFPLFGWMRRRKLDDKALVSALWAAAMLFLLYMARGFVVSHLDKPAALSLLRGTIALALASAAIAWPLWRWAPNTRSTIRLAPWLAAIMLLVVARAEVLRVSPHPRIDVFTLAREASNALWRGENPYAADYSNLYEGTNLDLGYSPGYNYFPTMLLANAFSARFAGDVRAAYILAEALCAFFIWRFTRALGWSREAAFALALLWSANSLSFQVVEKWNDSVVLAAIFGTLAFIAEQRWILAGVMFGLAVASKQYAPLAALPLAVWLWRCAPARAFQRLVVSSLVTAAIVFVPFLVHKGDWLVARTMLHFARTPFRDDSISLLNLSRIVLGFPVTSWVIRIAPYVGLVVGLTAAIASVTRERADAGDDWSGQLHKLLVGMLCIWAGFFHSIKQSFLNYDYFYFSLAALMLVTMVVRRDEHPSAE